MSLETNDSFSVNGWPRNETSPKSRHDMAHACRSREIKRQVKKLPKKGTPNRLRRPLMARAAGDAVNARIWFSPDGLLALSGGVRQFA